MSTQNDSGIMAAILSERGVPVFVCMLEIRAKRARNKQLSYYSRMKWRVGSVSERVISGTAESFTILSS